MPCGNKLAFFTRERAVVYRESHLYRRFGNLNERHGFYRTRRTNGVAYRDVFNTAYADDIARARALNRPSLQTFYLKYAYEFTAKFLAFYVIVARFHVLIYERFAPFYSAYAYSADVLVIVYRRNKHL